MVKRPWMITLLSIVLMASSALRLILYLLILIQSSLTQGTSSEVISSALTITIILAGACVLLAGGVLCFMGINLGRWLIIGWAIVAFILHQDYVIFRIVWLIVGLLMLFNKPANRFFRAKRAKLSYLEEVH
ncbi:hypothetical protein [Paenibacillus wenxiniae]|uniref:Uncharacterized protein n=1 Tax=Paenibacillus wenxiniae TaxID=1636843 RepID=A0ABW4RIH9_9BACL